MAKDWDRANQILAEAVVAAHARRPWAFPPDRGTVPDGIEIDGVLFHDGSIGLFLDAVEKILGSQKKDFFETMPEGEEKGTTRDVRKVQLPHMLRPVQVMMFSPHELKAELYT